MHNLWLEFLLEKYVEEEQPTLRCCGSCQGGCSNLAVCAFMCFGITNDMIGPWFAENKERLHQEYDEREQRSYMEYIQTEEELVPDEF